MTDSLTFIETMLAQSALQKSGYYHGPVDGNLSESARQALMGFQKDDGLAVTGELDDQIFGRFMTLRQEMVYATDASSGDADNGKSSRFAQIAEYFRSAFGAAGTA